MPVVCLGIFALDLSPDGIPVPDAHRAVDAALALPFAVLAVRRTGGSSLPVFALNPRLEIHAGQDRRVPDMLASLNEELATARGWAEPPPS